MHDGLAANVNYTWAHSLTNAEDIDEGQPTGNCYGVCHMDNGSGQPVNVNSFYQYDYGNADIDTRQRIALTMSYDLPFGKSMTGTRGLSGQRLVNERDLLCANRESVYGQNTDGTSKQYRPWKRPAQPGEGAHVPGWRIPSQPSAPRPMVGSKHARHAGSRACSATKSATSITDLAPRLWASRFSSHSRSWSNVHLQFRAELFNLLNTPTYGNPGTNLQSGFGTHQLDAGSSHAAANPVCSQADLLASCDLPFAAETRNWSPPLLFARFRSLESLGHEGHTRCAMSRRTPSRVLPSSSAPNRLSR